MGDNAGTFADVTETNKVGNEAAVVWLKWALGLSVLLLVLKVLCPGGHVFSTVFFWSWWVVFSPVWGLFSVAALIAALQVWARRRKMRAAKKAEQDVLDQLAARRNG